MNLSKRLVAGIAISLSATAIVVPAVVTNPAAQAAVTGYPVLKSNSSGDAVKAVQYLLNANGARVAVDGSYGPQTKAAVIAYQRSHKLAADGVAGKNTLTSLTPTLRQGSRGDAVKAVQTLLNAHGSHINVDGEFGPATASAVKKVQSSAKISADGVVGEKTWKALYAKGSGNTNGGNSGSGNSGSGGSNITANCNAQTKAWITEARDIMIKNGTPGSKIDANDICVIIIHESAQNPKAQNNWDSNAAAGHPSKGIMQTIDSTFNAYKLPGHGDIWNAVDNIIAASRYSVDRYGSVSQTPGIASMRSGGGYQGY